MEPLGARVVPVTAEERLPPGARPQAARRAGATGGRPPYRPGDGGGGPPPPPPHGGPPGGGRGARTLKDATNEALRDWVTNVTTTHYIIGSVVGPDPFPRVVRDFQSVIGREARAQVLERYGRLPTTVAACVGGGSNALGIFHAFLDDREVELVGVEAAGEGLASGRHSASLARGRPGVFHGSLR